MFYRNLHIMTFALHGKVLMGVMSVRKRIMAHQSPMECCIEAEICEGGCISNKVKPRQQVSIHLQSKRCGLNWPYMACELIDG